MSRKTYNRKHPVVEERTVEEIHADLEERNRQDAAFVPLERRALRALVAMHTVRRMTLQTQVAQ